MRPKKIKTPLGTVKEVLPKRKNVVYSDVEHRDMGNSEYLKGGMSGGDSGDSNDNPIPEGKGMPMEALEEGDGQPYEPETIEANQEAKDADTEAREALNEALKEYLRIILVNLLRIALKHHKMPQVKRKEVKVRKVLDQVEMLEETVQVEVKTGSRINNKSQMRIR